VWPKKAITWPRINRRPRQKKKRTYLKQTDVPGATLDEALRIPRAIHDNYAGDPTTPLMVAQAINIDPNGTQLKVLSGAAIAYGLLDGGAQAATMSMTELAGRILNPTEEGMDEAARREAILRPRVFGDFLGKYNAKSIPPENIGMNVLVEMGVPRDKAQDVFQRIVTSAEEAGLITLIKDKRYVNLNVARRPAPATSVVDEDDHNEIAVGTSEEVLNGAKTPIIEPPAKKPEARPDDERRRRVFLTHGKNKSFVDPLKKLLEFGELTPVVSVEKQSVSKPVPQKVMEDMRSCGAAIIHVDAETRMIDKDGKEHTVLNPNVLIEIGAAMAFYGQRFILLVREGVTLPSNLQGLYEVRYPDDTLGGEVTIKLLEAIRDIKNYSLPPAPAS
jgi:predicted nucleotide-binding protein